MRLRELGFRCCDLFAFEGFGHFDPFWLVAGKRQARQQVQEAVQRAGLEVSAFNCGLGYAVNDLGAAAQVDAAFLALLGLARQIGCPMMTVQTGGVRPGQDPGEALAEARESLLRLARLAREAGVALSFEPHVGAVVEDPAVAQWLAEALWPEVGITYDPSHFVMQEIPLADTEPLLNYTVHVHLRDAAPAQMQVPMATGSVDFAWLLRALRERGYAGAVSIEYLGAGEADVVRLRNLLLEMGLEL